MELFMHQHVERQVALRPESVALVSENDSSLSYGELNKRANQLAHQLVALGARPDSRVALWMERGLDLLVGILAVLKAGAAYVPLDPDYPAERLAYMLEDSAPMAFLTVARLRGRLPVTATGIIVVDAGPTSAALAKLPPDNLDPGALGLRPEHTACIIYTSGSTGLPKGVMLHHAGLSHLLSVQARLFDIRADSRVLQFSSPSFDASLLDISMALCHGARLCLAPRADLMPGDPLVRTLQHHGVTHLTLPPSALAVLDPGVSFPSVKTLVVAGEACPPAVTRRWAPRHRFINIYGPTETTIFVTAEVCKAEYAGPTPIGSPIDKVPIYILNDDLRPVPPGVRGELFVGGVCVSRGYLNKPELTAQRFLKDPFSPEPGARMYKTGDVGRWLPDGSIEYIGRSDFQVKLRGFRVELGEIEARLAACSGVREAVVLCREDVPGDKRLAAYLTKGAETEPPTIESLRAQLTRFLPEYMLPSAWVWLDRFPLTPNGKADRAALPVPQADAFQTAPFEAPAGALEVALAGIWLEVLQVKTVGRSDNFFALGGHSLLATQLASRVQARMGIELLLLTVFEAPRFDAFATRVADAMRVRRPASADRKPPGIDRVPRDGPLRCSYSQRQMWLIQQLNPQTTAYNMPFALRLRGPLDAGLLARALDQVARRYEAFRTRFVCVDGEPAQLIEAHPDVALTRIDLRDVPATSRETEARGVLREACLHRFELTEPGLHTTTLVQLGETDHVLLWLIHHAIGDHWAAGVLMRDLQCAYTALVQGQPLHLAAPAIEFADYAEWQRSDVHSAAIATQLAFWRVQLQGLQPLVLPTDKPRLGQISGTGGAVYLDLGEERIGALKQFSLHQGVTPFMTLLACFNVMLSRYSGQSDIPVGVPISNRRDMASESLVGAMVNTVVIRTRVSDELSFAQLLANVKETALQAYANQDTPFNLLVQELVVRRDKNFSPLVQVMFNVQNAPYGVDGFAGLKTEAFAFDHGAAQFDISMKVDTDIFGQVYLGYADDLFEEATANRMLAGYVALLDQLISNPALSVLDCEPRGRAELHELQRWNTTTVPFESGLRLGDLIRRQAVEDGDAVAVIFEGRRVSYRELDESACALAVRLRALGAGPGSLVGVGLERSIELVTALLGVVYSGAAYVPLDPSYPIDRLARMCEDACLSLVVSRAVEMRRLGPALPDAVCVIDIGGAEDKSAAAAFSLIGCADDPAYVIFTSGSTGRPKGAMNAHKGIVNRLQWMQAEYRLTPQDRVVQKTPYSFDVSVWEFFWPLMTGATIVVARPDGHRDAGYLAQLIQAEAVTVLHFVPSMLQIFLDDVREEQFRSVRQVLCSGEALPIDTVDRFFHTLPQARLANLYGPTEAAVDVTCWNCVVKDPRRIVPIGRPIANTQMHVLDARMRPQPVGVCGDLYIGGVQVGMGYVSRPELTAERFIPDPFNPGGRLYKTGDLARWLGDGVIDYLGRSDDQVKIRGHRIELGEIEACLASHRQVAHCVVIMREHAPGDQRLVAYVVPREAIPTAGAVREHLRRQVPEYMVPQHVVVLESIPLLANGKINRSALPAPTETAVVRDSSFWVPRTDTEVALARIWTRLLGVDRISTTDNFFDLGGHSLLAMRAVSEIHRELGVRIDVRSLVFESLAQLAVSLEATDISVRSYAPVKPKAATVKYLVGGLQRMLLSRGTREDN